MSKGIGCNYIKRSKRFHLAYKVRDKNLRLSVICDRAFYHDGPFKYKLPRYFRDQLYRKKFPCDTKIWDNKLKQYVPKVVYRYKSKNMLALQMQVEVRNRLMADYARRCSEVKSKYPHFSAEQVDLFITRSEVSARMARQKTLYSKSARFYNSQRFKQLKF